MQHAENAEHEHDGEEGNGITATPLTSGGDMVSRDESVIMAGSDADKAADFANYFSSYAYLYHQKQMLTDHTRMKSYFNAIMNNSDKFSDKVVLDVGTGSGILAIWCAQAGASRVYAIEYTDMAKHAQRLVEHNSVQDRVTIMQTSLEDLQLPEKVDVIVSEWMGYFLLRESMLDSVIRARNRWLKEDGLLFPSHATMLWGPIQNEEDRQHKQQEYYNTMQEWERFKLETTEYYNVDMGALDEAFIREQREYYLTSAVWGELHPEHLLCTPAAIKHLDLNTCTLTDVRGVEPAPFSFQVPAGGCVSGFAGWFTVDFHGSERSACLKPNTLSTGPTDGYTHWGQQLFYLMEPIECTQDTIITGTVSLFRQVKNQRLYEVEFSVSVNGAKPTVYKYEMP